MKINIKALMLTLSKHGGETEAKTLQQVQGEDAL